MHEVGNTWRQRTVHPQDTLKYSAKALLFCSTRFL